MQCPTMPFSTFEQLLAFHAAPALAGIKPANLISVSKARFPQWDALLNRYRQEMAVRGISLEVVCSCEKSLLLLVYREKQLEDHLAKPEVAALLDGAGYPASLPERLGKLRQRLREESFPHEIGAFLGYPPADIRSFVEQGGRGALLTGPWKVYHNVEEAKACFARYDRCRSALCRHLARGKSLLALFPAA